MKTTQKTASPEQSIENQENQENQIQENKSFEFYFNKIFY